METVPYTFRCVLTRLPVMTTSCLPDLMITTLVVVHQGFSSRKQPFLVACFSDCKIDACTSCQGEWIHAFTLIMETDLYFCRCMLTSLMLTSCLPDLLGTSFFNNLMMKIRDFQAHFSDIKIESRSPRSGEWIYVLTPVMETVPFISRCVLHGTLTSLMSTSCLSGVMGPPF